MAYQGYHCAREALRQKAEEHMLSVVQSRKGSLEAWLTEKRRDLEMIAQNLYLEDELGLRASSGNDARAESLVRLLGAVQSQSDAYEGLILFDSRWRVVAATRVRMHSDHVKVSAEAREAVEREGEAFFGPAHGHEDIDVGLHVVHPVTDAGGDHVGAVFANLDLTRGLGPLLQERSGLGRSGKVYAVSKDLEILTEPFKVGRPTVVGQRVDVLVRELASGPVPTVRQYRDYSGTEVLGTAVALPSLRWTLVAEMDMREALEWLGVLRWRAFATAAVTALVILIVSMLASRRLGWPFRELARVAVRIREGHADERVPPLPGAEAQEVAESFNTMLDALEDTQNKLVQAARLASMGELASSIAHEMRNPLSSIKMNLQALERQVASDPDYRELAEIAGSQVSRVERMLSDLLNYGRPVELTFAPVRFRDLAQDTLGVMSETATARNARLDVQDGLGERRIWIDREQMCRALTNLVDNAVQAVPDGGQVQLSSRVDPEHSGRARIEVLDNGPGLPPHVEANLFRPFFTTRSEGTGLGLANVKKIVELHGGSVSAHNRDEGGAIFAVSIPLAE
jgi:signal transduction histidine kinase